MTKILLNKVFAGEYLDKNIGHEAVCLFKADNGEHYIYITPYGEVGKTNELKENDYILLVSYCIFLQDLIMHWLVLLISSFLA